VPGRHVRAAGKRLDVQRLRVLPVDPVADAAQPREVAKVLRHGGTAGRLRDYATSHRSCLAPLASHPALPRSASRSRTSSSSRRPTSSRVASSTRARRCCSGQLRGVQQGLAGPDGVRRRQALGAPRYKAMPKYVVSPASEAIPSRRLSTACRAISRLLEAPTDHPPAHMLSMSNNTITHAFFLAPS
jgi:hypothetical protein